VDLNLARTFLEIVATRSFVRAAERLHVTQTAVSARVRALEDELGQPLFVRNKAGASLTTAGERFLRYAQTLVQVWERARHQVAVPPGRRALVTLGCEVSLWDPLLLEWLLWMREAAPQLALRTEVGVAGALLDQVGDGTLDIAVVYSPQHRPGLEVELLIQERLVFVTTARTGRAPARNDYVYVDWGREFAAQHSLAHPTLANAAVFAGLGPLGREYILHAGGSGYFRESVVSAHVESGKLRLVKDAPVFMYPAYAVYSEDADPKIVAPALAGLRHVAQVTQRSGKRPSARAKKRAPAALRSAAARR